MGNAAWRLPGGGWESNILDLAKFANGLLQGSLLRNTARLWTTVPGNPSYGYGVKYTRDKSHVWHEGMHFNSRALLYLLPGSVDRTGIVIIERKDRQNGDPESGRGGDKGLSDTGGDGLRMFDAAGP